MKEQEYQSKFFLTGFLLASGLIIYITMVFVMLFLAMIVTSLNSYLVSFVVVILIALGYFYSLHRFEQNQSYSRMVLWYVLTICMLGLLISSICYVSVLAIAIVNMFAGAVIAIPVTIILGYIIVVEIYSVAALLAASFELREIEHRKFSVVYILTAVTMLIVAYVFRDLTFYSIGSGIITVIAILITAFYILFGIKNGPVKMEIESVEDRYKFVVKALIHCALAPIHIPICMKNRLFNSTTKI